MSLEVFGDGGDGGDDEDLVEAADRYGYSLRDDGTWWNEADDTDGDTIMTSEQMWQYVSDRREGDLEDMALSGL